jgi:Luciferase-like monooxygenase
MEFGLFTEFESPAGMDQAVAFDESLAQMKAAEDLGLDAVWLAEIHFQKDRSVLASPLVIAAALAACTRRIKIGIAVQVLPLSHPCGWPRTWRRSTISRKDGSSSALAAAGSRATTRGSTSRTARAASVFSRRSTWMNCGGQIPGERVLTSMRLFAEQVIPRLN